MKAIAIDFESFLISEEAPVPPPVCLSFFDGKVSGLWVGMEEMRKGLQTCFSSYDKIVAHNMTFEAGIIYQYFPELRDSLWKFLTNGKMYCTKLGEKLLDNIREKPLFNHSLANLVKVYFEKDISDTKTDPDAWRLRYSELNDVPKAEWPETAIDYAIQDSIYAYDIYKIQEKLNINFKPHVIAEFCLNLMGHTGILIDQGRVAELKAEVKNILQPAYDFLLEAGMISLTKTGGYKKNSKEFREYVKDTFTEHYKTDKGAISISNIDLDKYLQEKPDKIVEAFALIADYEKVLTSFVNNLETAKPYIRSEYNAIVSSGRTSSKKSSIYPSVNIQQMPREVKNVTWDVRNCFIPREGFKICSIDYSGLELCSTAHQLFTTFRRSKMAELLNLGDVPTDMHSRFACVLKSLKEKKQVTYEEFVANKGKPGYKEFRQLAKPINLGFPGGIGYDTMRMLLAKDGVNPKFAVIHESESEKEILGLLFKFRNEYDNLRCKQTGPTTFALVADELVGIKKSLFNLYPELGWFLRDRHTNFMTGSIKMMKNDYGVWEREPMYAYETHGVKRDWCTYTALCNGFLMQTPSAAGAKDATTHVIEKYADNPNMNPLAFIHDEIVFEVKEGQHMYGIIEDVATIMLTRMQKALPSVRIAVEAELMDYWMKAGGFWSKQYWLDSNKSEVKSK